MRKRRGAMHGTQLAERARGRGLGRTALLAGTAMMLLLGSAQAAAAQPKLSSVNPPKGCPGELVEFKGTGFTGSSVEVEWSDKGAQKFPNLTTEGKVISSTMATAIEPMMLQTQGPGGEGSVAVGGSNSL